MTDLRALRVPPAYGGWNTEASPEYLPETQAPLVENLLCRPGKLVLRGPIKNSVVLGSDPAYAVVPSAMVFKNNVLTQHVKIGSIGYYANRVVTNGDDTIGSVTAVPALSNITVGRSIQDDTAAYAVNNIGEVVKWTGTTTAPTTLSATAPTNLTAIEQYAERVFAGQITDDGGGLRFTRPGGISPTPALSDWTDPVSGLNNQILVGAADEEIRGFGKIDSGLVIFKSMSTWVLRGTGSSSFTIKQFSSEIGCPYPETIVNFEDGCFFLSLDGYYRFDGTSMTLVSDPISTTLDLALRLGVPGGATAGPALPHASYIGAGHILLTTGRNYKLGSDYGYVSDFAALYNTRTRTWSKFTSAGLLGGVPHFSASLRSNQAFGWQNDRFYNLNTIARPELASATGQDTLATTTAIAARWHSRTVKLATPAAHAQLHRFLLDYRGKWAVSLVRGAGTTALSALTLDASTSAYRARAARDCFGEADDVQVRVEWNFNESTALAELYDAHVVFQPARERPART